MSRPSIRVLVAAVAATLAAVKPGVAQQMETATLPGDRWTVTLAPYLWATSMDGHSPAGGIKSDVDVPFSDLLKDLSFGAMLAVDVRKARLEGRGQWSVGARLAGR